MDSLKTHPIPHDDASYFVPPKVHGFVKGYVLIVLACLLLTPSLPMPAGVPAMRLDDVLLIVFPVLAVLLFRRLYVDARFLILMLIMLSFQASILVGSFVGYSASFGDSFYLLRICKYLGAVALASMMVVEVGRIESLRFVGKASMLLGLGVAAIAVQQFFDLGSLNASYVHIVAPTQFDTLVGGYGWPRPVGMVGNPNELGFLFVLLGMVGVILPLIDRTVDGRWQLLSLLMFLAAALTLSRSAAISGIAAFLILFGSIVLAGFRYSSGDLVVRKHGLKVVTFTSVLIAGLLAWLVLDQSAAAQIAWRFHPENYGSFEARFDSWEANADAWRDSPVFGVGPLRRAGAFGAADNEHMLLLRTGGVFLYALVLSLLVIGVFSPSVDGHSRSASLALSAMTLLYMIPAVAFYSLVAFPYMLMIFVILGPLRIGTIKA